MNIHANPAVISMPAAYLGDGLYEIRDLPNGSIYNVTCVHDQFDIAPSLESDTLR